jgi:hypothetical protein
MKDWKTTLSGVLAAIGGYLTQSQTGLLQIVGQVMTGIGLLLLGYHSSDKATK